MYDATLFLGKDGGTQGQQWTGTIPGCLKLLSVKSAIDATASPCDAFMIHYESATDGPLDPVYYGKQSQNGVAAISSLAKALKGYGKPIMHYCPPKRASAWQDAANGNAASTKQIREWRQGLRLLKSWGYGLGLTKIVADCYEFFDYQKSWALSVEETIGTYEDIFGLPVMPLMMLRYNWSGGAARGGVPLEASKAEDRLGWLHERCGCVGVWDGYTPALGYMPYEAWTLKGTVERLARTL